MDEPVDVRFAAPPREGARRAPRRRRRGRSPWPWIDEDEPDPIVDGQIDLGALAAEFSFSALDPYPRKPGVDFAPAAEPDASQTPLAGLADRAEGRLNDFRNSTIRRVSDGRARLPTQARATLAEPRFALVAEAAIVRGARGGVSRVRDARGVFAGMANEVRIALDAMGGDRGPSVVVPAAAIALVRRPDVSSLFYGDEKVVGRCSAAIPRWPPRRGSCIPMSRSR